jgi:hypothetical protein
MLISEILAYPSVLSNLQQNQTSFVANSNVDFLTHLADLFTPRGQVKMPLPLKSGLGSGAAGNGPRRVLRRIRGGGHRKGPWTGGSVTRSITGGQTDPAGWL